MIGSGRNLLGHHRNFLSKITGAVVVPGRRIGVDAIIAAGAVVLKDVPDRAVVAGNPAKPLNEHESTHNFD